jgi:hypothetical protein
MADKASLRAQGLWDELNDHPFTRKPPVTEDTITIPRRQWNDLMDANNRYQQEARDARAKIGGTTISEEREALFKQARFWLEFLVLIADVEPSDCSFAVRAKNKVTGEARDLHKVNLKTDVLDKLNALFGPIPPEVLEMMKHQADEIAGTTD